MPGLSGVGISFGADRIYDVLNSLNLYPENLSGASRVMFVNFGEKEGMKAMEVAKMLRRQGISVTVYPDATKMKTQRTLANSERIPFVAIIGSDELENNTVTLKNMTTGEQQTLTADQLAEALK